MATRGRYYQVEWDDEGPDFRNPCPNGTFARLRDAERAARRLARNMPVWSVRVIAVERWLMWDHPATMTYEEWHARPESAA